MKSITICADDFGYNASVSQGILNLIQAKRISATSCLVTMPNWPQAAKKIKLTPIHLGLHFNLTEGPLLTLKQSFSLPQLILKSYFRILNPAAIQTELKAQINEFIKYIGRPPDFIDGHQHIHQLPVIRYVLVNFYLHIFIQKKPYIRISSNGFIRDALTSPKAFIIGSLGAHFLKKLLQKNHIPHNSSFAGIYGLKQKNYEACFKKFIKLLNNEGLLMCHPGLPEKGDHLADTRFKEYNFLMKTDFLNYTPRFQLSDSPII